MCQIEAHTLDALEAEERPHQIGEHSRYQHHDQHRRDDDARHVTQHRHIGVQCTYRYRQFFFVAVVLPRHFKLLAHRKALSAVEVRESGHCIGRMVETPRLVAEAYLHVVIPHAAHGQLPAQQRIDRAERHAAKVQHQHVDRTAVAVEIDVYRLHDTRIITLMTRYNKRVGFRNARARHAVYRPRVETAAIERRRHRGAYLVGITIHRLAVETRQPQPLHQRQSHQSEGHHHRHYLELSFIHCESYVRNQFPKAESPKQRYE